MKINSISEIYALLDYCKAISISEPTTGGNFYELMQQKFCYPDNSIQTREFINKRESSVIVPITEEGNFVFVVQPIGLSEKGSLVEFPSGYFEFGENGMEAGIRELKEETGYEAKKIIDLNSHYQDPGSIKARVHTYLALGCTWVKEQKLDKGEFIKYVEVPPKIVHEMLQDNLLQDANTYIALSKAISKLYLEEIFIDDIENNIGELNIYRLTGK